MPRREERPGHAGVEVEGALIFTLSPNGLSLDSLRFLHT